MAEVIEKLLDRQTDIPTPEDLKAFKGELLSGALTDETARDYLFDSVLLVDDILGSRLSLIGGLEGVRIHLGEVKLGRLKQVIMDVAARALNFYEGSVEYAMTDQEGSNESTAKSFAAKIFSNPKEMVTPNIRARLNSIGIYEFVDEGIIPVSSFITAYATIEDLKNKVNSLNGSIELDPSAFEVNADGKITVKIGNLPATLKFNDGSEVNTQETKAETLIDRLPIKKTDKGFQIIASDGTNQFTIVCDADTGICDFDGLKFETFRLGRILWDITGDASYEDVYLDPTDGVIKASNGIAKHIVENVQVAETATATDIVAQDSITLGGEKRTTWPSEGTGNVEDTKVDLTAQFGTGNIDPKTLREFLDWIILRLNGGANQTNKLDLYFNDNDALEVRYDQTPIMLFENGKVNFLNQGLELIGDTNNPLSALNSNQIKTLTNQLIASASLTEDKVFYRNATIKKEQDANENNYITFTSDITDVYLDGDTDNTGYVGPNLKYFVPETEKSNLLGFELLIGGEQFDTLIGAPTDQDYYWNEYLAVPTLALDKETDWMVSHNIFDKKPDGTKYIKNQVQLVFSYLFTKSEGTYKLLLREFVEYTIKTYNTSGDLTKTDSGTQYLNDPDFTLDKQPLRVYIGGTGYTSTGNVGGSAVFKDGVVVDEVNWGDKLETYGYFDQSDTGEPQDIWPKLGFYWNNKGELIYADLGNETYPTNIPKVKIRLTGIETLEEIDYSLLPDGWNTTKKYVDTEISKITVGKKKQVKDLKGGSK